MKSRHLSAGLVAGLLFTLAAPVMAETPAVAVENHQRIAAIYPFPVGKLQVTALSDGTVPLDAHKLLKNIEAAQIDGLLGRAFEITPPETSINAFLIRDGARHILVDTGAGDVFGPGFGGNLLASLKAAGEKPEDVTDILITHLHSDHVGGVLAKGKIAFPNAILHVSQPDLDFFSHPSEADRTSYGQPYFDIAQKAIGPYQQAGKLKPFADGAEILPGIVATIHPGHTPGSSFYTVTSEGKAIVFVGDIVHVAAVQFPQPGVAIQYDFDPARAVTTRQDAFKVFADGRALIAAPHLPFPGVGHVSAESGGAFAWHPVEYRNRAGE
jgi:glyoxylase-like metal-dependent hydrolase (beta-lactamase superfamily II)